MFVAVREQGSLHQEMVFHHRSHSSPTYPVLPQTHATSARDDEIRSCHPPTAGQLPQSQWSHSGRIARLYIVPIRQAVLWQLSAAMLQDVFVLFSSRVVSSDVIYRDTMIYWLACAVCVLRPLESRPGTKTAT